MRLGLKALACAIALVGACTGDDTQSDGGTSDKPGGGAVDPGTGSECLVSGVALEIGASSTSALDLVFAIDDSASMASEQQALRDALPRFLEALTSGDKDGDGSVDFTPVRDLQVGVVSTDLGLSGIDHVPGCSGLGDDGVLNNVGSPDVPGCSPQPLTPRFLSFNTEHGGDILSFATDLSCLAALGASGCSIEQPLESLLKAVWPADDMDVWFLTNPSGFGGAGQGGPLGANGSIVRDGSEGTLVGLVVVTDEEDCSMGNTSHFAEGLGSDDPLSLQGTNVRCFFEAQRDRNPAQPEVQNNLYGPSRYTQTFRALRPGREELVVFAAIVGMPPDLVEPEDLAAVDFRSKAQADAFYNSVLGDSRLIETIDDQGTDDVADDDLVPSCDRGADDRAYPPRRIVEVARSFGANGVVQSICQDDLRPAMNAIIDVLGKQLGAPCLPRSLERDADGRIACDLEWQLPPAGSAGSGTPSACSQLPFLEKLDGVSARGGARCRLEQIAVDDAALEDDEAHGWFYDDFTDEAATCVGGARGHRIAFTEGAEPPDGVSVRLLCHNVQRSDGASADDAPACLPGPAVANASVVGDPCFTVVVPPLGFDDSVAYVEPVSEHCGGGACIVYHLGGDPRNSCTAWPPSGCVPGENTDCPEPVRCASVDEIEQRVYCSCRCDAPEGFDTCACPSGFSCVSTLEIGPEAAQGSYCVRNSSVAN